MSTNPASIPYTGQQMVPYVTDRVVETHHWQRYLFFRPWYENVKIVDVGSGEGYGADYAATFASELIGFELNESVVGYAKLRYPETEFECKDAVTYDFSQSDLVLCFQTLNQVADPELLLSKLASCKQRVVVSVSNPKASREESPENAFTEHVWTPEEFTDLINRQFAGRQIRFLSQERDWPGNIVSGILSDSLATIAVIGDGELPVWPSVGIATATHDNWEQLDEAIFGFSRGYPGKLRFAIVANGCSEEQLKAMRAVQTINPRLVHLIEENENRGFGVGMNIGLDFLRREESCELFAITNDDVVPCIDFLPELVSAMQELSKVGHNPGVIGPVSNSITGQQQVQIGAFSDYPTLIEQAKHYHRGHHSTVTEVNQLRGLFMLIHPDCLEKVGGFDPRFGLGNFEDDDHNLRCSLAGFSLWIAEGAFLFHYGSSTFQKLGIDYSGNIARNAEVMKKKWQIQSVEEWPNVQAAPDGVELFVPLSRPKLKSEQFVVRMNGEKIDLVQQASDVEFAGWVFHKIQDQPPALRKAVIDVIENKQISA